VRQIGDYVGGPAARAPACQCLAKMVVSRRDFPSMLPGLFFDASWCASCVGTVDFESSRNLREQERRRLREMLT